jgi:uncharacterized protein (TIGR00725 family)
MSSLAGATNAPLNRTEANLPSVQIQALLTRLRERQASQQRHTQAVGIIGPGDGDAQVCAAARIIARALASAGMVIVCGGRSGVMAAACQGASEAGGIAIGILPEEDTSAANPYLTVAIPTGMGEMRNALIARSSLCLLAIGGGMGTISEMALGLKWGKTVFTLHEDLQLPGARRMSSTDEMLIEVIYFLLGSFVGAD